MAFSLNGDTFGQLIDPFDGTGDLERLLIRTPCDPDTTFSDDPLRMIRAVRFAAQLGFDIEPETFDAIERNRERISIVSKERIVTELNKILLSPVPSIGFDLFDRCGLLPLIFPELSRLKGVERVGKHAHKDNFVHTLKVLDNIARHTDKLWLRWAALLHDIGKPRTKAYDPKNGMDVPRARSRRIENGRGDLPGVETADEREDEVCPETGFFAPAAIILAEDVVTDSAVRRLLFEAGDDIDDLMTLCEADITSANDAKVKRYLQNFEPGTSQTARNRGERPDP